MLKTHADLVEEKHAEIDREVTVTDDPECLRHIPANGESRDDIEKRIDRAKEDDYSAENKLLNKLISAGCSLEAQARRITMTQLPKVRLLRLS